MAQQNFRNYRYVANDGTIYKIRASTKVAASQTTAANPNVDASQPSVNVGRSSRERGIRPRAIRLRREAGTSPNLKVYYNQLPVFVSGDVAGLLAGGPINIDGVTWTPSEFIPESIR